MSEKAKYDVAKLAPLLCCENKWHPIYMIMSTLDIEELKQFRKELRQYTPYHYLHRTLEREFRNSIGD
jgi:hypothetical protein